MLDMESMIKCWYNVEKCLKIPNEEWKATTRRNDPKWFGQTGLSKQCIPRLDSSPIRVYSVCHLSCRMTKPTKWPVHPGKTQISLGIHPV